jgi:integrative and conjugative element protein (TIGR02256 family)
MNFTHSRRGVLKLGPEALATMQSYEQHAPDATEAGGFLLGRYLRDGHDLVVDMVTVPMPGDVRERYGFHRNSPGHQAEIDAAWIASGGTCVLLGNWHTHAEPHPTPSSVDLEDWRRVLITEIQPDEACFFVIVGQREIRVWEGQLTVVA